MPGLVPLSLIVMLLRMAVMSASLATVLLMGAFVHLMYGFHVCHSNALFLLFRMLLPGQYFMLEPFGLNDFQLPQTRLGQGIVPLRHG